MKLSILQDDDFKNAVEHYYGGYLTVDQNEAAIRYITGKSSRYANEHELLNEMMNVIKAGVASNTPYEELVTELYNAKFSKLMGLPDDKEYVLDIISLILYHINMAYPDVRNPYIKDASAVKEEPPETDAYSITDDPVDGWDEYFFNVCRQVARNSKCLSRRIGAVLVKDKTIVSTGYNGPPRNIPNCQDRWKIDKGFIEKYKDKIVKPIDEDNPVCPRYSLGAKSGEMLEICPAGHAEENAILNAAWHGISTKGATMYMTCGIPCHRCLTKILNAGVAEIVCTNFKVYDDNSDFLLEHGKVKVRLYDFIKK